MYVPLKTTVPHGFNVPSVPSPWHTTHGGPEWFQEHSSERAPQHHLISPLEDSRQDLCYDVSRDTLKAWWGRPARSYPIPSVHVPPGGLVGPSSFSHLPERSASASDGDTANTALKANPVPWSTSIETKLLFWKLPPPPAKKKIIPHWKEGSAGSLLGLVHPWRLWSCDMIPICLHGGLSASLIVCASLCSALMFISLQYLQRDFRNKSLCKWEHAYKIQRNIKIH